MKLTNSARTAILLAGAIAAYFVVRMVLRGGQAPPAAEIVEQPFAVVTQTVSPAPWREEVQLRGRTQAFRKIEVRAETQGIVAATPVEPGTAVEAGAVLCTLRIDARNAARREARAALEKARLDHQAAIKLAKEGFRSDTAVAGAKAALDLARANLEQADLAIGKTDMTAPWAGAFDARLVEVGDLMNVGDACGVLIQRSPFLVVGSVSEREVAKIAKGDRGVAQLSTGERVEGVVRLVSASADPTTRTFEVQIEVPNTDGSLRDGVTAEMTIEADRRDAFHIPRSALSFDEKGRLGVRIVKADDTVAFTQTRLLGEDQSGVFVSGLDPAARIITRGQDYVTNGQKVTVAAAGPAKG